MTKFGSFIQILIALFAAVNGYILVNVAIQNHAQGPAPEKHLKSVVIFSADTLDTLKKAGNAIEISAKAGDAPIDNVYTPVLLLQNTGEAPIQSTDFEGKIGIKTVPPWKIITVLTPGGGGAVSLLWSKRSDTEFRADPALINPGDTVSTTVYMTKVDGKDDGETGDSATQLDKPPLKWDMRVVNLRAIDYGTGVGGETPELINAVVFYDGNKIIGFLLCASLYMAIYFSLVYYVGWFASKLITLVAITVAAGAISIMAAGATVSRLLPSQFISTDGPLDSPIMVLNAVLISCLCWFAYRRRMASQADPLDEKPPQAAKSTDGDASS